MRIISILFPLFLLVILRVTAKPRLKGMGHGVAAPRLHAVFAEFLGSKPGGLERASVVGVPWIII